MDAERLHRARGTTGGTETVDPLVALILINLFSGIAESSYSPDFYAMLHSFLRQISEDQARQEEAAAARYL